MGFHASKINVLQSACREIFSQKMLPFFVKVSNPTLTRPILESRRTGADIW